MFNALPTLQAFEEMLFQECSDPDSKTPDPVIIIEDQALARRVSGKMPCHVTVVSERWPESTPEERTALVESVCRRALDSHDVKRCTLWQGLTKDEAEEKGLNITFAHPDFDINKPHDSEHFLTGNLSQS